jgi:serine protease inhibitor
MPFIADRPFLYLIRERSTGAILFIGRMDDPRFS